MKVEFINGPEDGAFIDQEFRERELFVIPVHLDWEDKVLTNEVLDVQEVHACCKFTGGKLVFECWEHRIWPKF